MTSHIPDKGQVMVCSYGLYSNAHRGKIPKSGEVAHKTVIIDEEYNRFPRRGWAEMIRKVNEVDPLLSPQCAGQMKVIAFIRDYSVVDKIIKHLKLSFKPERPPPP